MSMDELQIGAGTPDEKVIFDAMREYDAMWEYNIEFKYLQERAENRNPGENILLGMMALGNAFRFVEQLFREGQINWATYAGAGNILCKRYEELRRDAFIFNFSLTMNAAIGKENL
jgi:hypothetical protein